MKEGGRKKKETTKRPPLVIIIAVILTQRNSNKMKYTFIIGSKIKSWLRYD